MRRPYYTLPTLQFYPCVQNVPACLRICRSATSHYAKYLENKDVEEMREALRLIRLFFDTVETEETTKGLIWERAFRDAGLDLKPFRAQMLRMVKKISNT